MGPFEFTWAPNWMLVIATLGGGAFLTLGIGIASSFPLLSVRSASALRQLQDGACFAPMVGNLRILGSKTNVLGT